VTGAAPDTARARLEVCVDSAAGARAAALGADRLELCARLEVGGLTPETDLLRSLTDEGTVPVFAMIRPRPGDFVYSPKELAAMEASIDAARDLGAAGLVLGTLHPDGSLDAAALERLLRRADGLPVTFHRAFDGIHRPFEALEVLLELGVARLLTSGDGPRAWEGRDLLRRLVEAAGEELVVMPGGGVRQDHVLELLAATGAREVHSSVVLDLTPTSPPR